MPIFEPGLDELLARNRERLSFTLDVAEAIDGAEFVYVAVGTPPTYSGDADLSAVWTVIDELPAVDHRVVVAMKSTVPVGTGEKVRHRLDQRGLGHVGYVSNPEFTAEGTAVRDFMEPDRIVVGAFDEADGDAVEALHRGIEAPVVRSDVASAEMIKLAANAALMTRISFINEIANVCEATGADVVKVAEGIGHDRRIGKSFLRAGVGFGGSCFPKDSLALKQLAANSGYHFQVLNAVIEVNELQKRRVIGKLTQVLGSLRGKRIALLGLAFKPNTDDTREAPAFVLAGRLLAEGADVVAWDPVAHADGLHGVEQVAHGRRRRPRRRRRRARHRMARAGRRRLGGGRGAACARPSSSTVATCSTPRRCARQASRTTESAARPPPSADGGDRPRGRQGGAARRCRRRAAEVARRGGRPTAAGVADRPARHRQASTA